MRFLGVTIAFFYRLLKLIYEVFNIWGKPSPGCTYLKILPFDLVQSFILQSHRDFQLEMKV